MKKILLPLLLIFGCAKTNITSLKNPEYEKTPVKSLTVVVDTQDMALLKEVDEMFKDNFMDYETKFVPTSEILAFNKNLPPEALLNKLKKKGAQAYLFVSTGAQGERDMSFYVPQQVEGVRSNYVYGGVETKLIKSGGYHQKNLQGQYSFYLFDINSKKNIWRASVSAKMSGAFASFDTIYSKVVSDIVYQMEEDQIIKRKP